MRNVDSPFVRHPANPLLAGSDLPHESMLVFNAGVARFGGRFLMAYRNDRGSWGDPNIYASDIGFAWSDDGISWKAEPETRFDREGAIALLADLEPHRDLDLELWRVYDPRLTVVAPDGVPRLIMTFAADTTHGLRSGIAESDDGRTWRAVSLGPPDNRNNVVFPELIDGQWARLERPMNTYGDEPMGGGRFGIWIASSPDLVHWGDTRFVCDAGWFPFADDKIGPGPPPVKTELGWLCLIHAVSLLPTFTQRGWESDWNKVYSMGAMLLDLDDPSRIIDAAPMPLLTPTADYETAGFRHDVIFPTAALTVPTNGAAPDGTAGADDELWVYYGAADTTVALATARVGDVLSCFDAAS